MNIQNTVFTLYYDTRKGLEARGVNLKATAYISPSPFPASQGRGCTPPRNWNGSSNTSIKLNPEIEAIKNRKATDKAKRILTKQLQELEELQENDNINLDKKILETIKNNIKKISR